MRHEALTAPGPTDWVTEYAQYQSGGWSTVSLMNDTGNPADVRIRDCHPAETTLLRHMPATRDFLSTLDLRYMWVRLARLGPNSFLWEHRDYEELDAVERYRLHVPLVTNRSAVLVTGGRRICLEPGRIWRLKPTHAHGACNLLGPDRYHLLIDCYADDRLAELMAGEWIDDADVVDLPRATEDDVLGYARTAWSLARLGHVGSAETYLLRLFYVHALAEGQVYDLITSLHESLDDSAAAARWREHRLTRLGGAA
ncbi:aspartyl/asparaginyl beta-hydroxylase domain-containing protein [Nocardia camponoti]|nr:aspartyl/asparaginyl beta-hydroxylase domain-containing protein [Nocardia camponoti]